MNLWFPLYKQIPNIFHKLLIVKYSRSGEFHSLPKKLLVTDPSAVKRLKAFSTCGYQQTFENIKVKDFNI